jgi:hypothetical protein
MVENRNSYRSLVGKPEGKSPLRRHRCRWGIILKWILERKDGIVWTGFVWFRIETSGGLLETWLRTFWFHKMLGNS